MPQVRLGSKFIPSRFGDLVLMWREEESGPKVTKLLLPSDGTRAERVVGARYPQKAMDVLSDQIRRYLGGQAAQLPIDQLDSNCCSEFQWQVLMVEMTIPRGRVCSYSRLAAMTGNPRAARAVGSALARNPFPIIIPCHRTVRRDGTLGGFGGGLPMKRELLEMEGVGFDSRGRVQWDLFWP